MRRDGAGTGRGAETARDDAGFAAATFAAEGAAFAFAEGAGATAAFARRAEGLSLALLSGSLFRFAISKLSGPRVRPCCRALASKMRNQGARPVVCAVNFICRGFFGGTLVFARSFARTQACRGSRAIRATNECAAGLPVPPPAIFLVYLSPLSRTLCIRL
jgi:hypothetical protein